MEQPVLPSEAGDASFWRWIMTGIGTVFIGLLTWLRQVDGKRITAIEETAKDLRLRVDQREEKDRERWEAFLERFDRKIDQLRTDFLHAGSKRGGSSD